MAVSETDKCVVCNAKLTEEGQCPACDWSKLDEEVSAKEEASEIDNAERQNNRGTEIVTADFRLADERRPDKALTSAYLINLANSDRYALRQSTNKVGRDRSNDVAVPDDHYMSRNHALILQIKGDFWIEDLDSTNCTLLNGKPVKERKPLLPGDKLILGKTEFTFAIE